MAPDAEASQRLLRFLSIALLLVAALLAWPYRGAILFALVVAYLSWPLYDRVRFLVHRRWIAGLSVLLALTLFIVGPLVVIGALLMEQAQGVAQGLVNHGGLNAIILDALTRAGVPANSVQALEARASAALAERLQGMVVPALGAALDFALGLLVFYVVLYFALVDGRRGVRWIGKLLPLLPEQRERLQQGIGERVRALVWGSLIVAVVQGILAGIGWWLLGFPAPVFWGVVMTVCAILPVLGPFVVLLPAAVMAFIAGDIGGAIGLLVLNFILVGLVDDLLRAYVVGRWTSAHPAIILIGVVGGLPVFGLSGIILGPLLLSLLIPILDAWRRPGKGALDVDDEPDEPTTPGPLARLVRRRRGRAT